MASVCTHASMHACVCVLFPCDTRSWGGFWLGFYRAEVPIQKSEEEGDSNRLIGARGAQGSATLVFSHCWPRLSATSYMTPSAGRRIPVGRDASMWPHIWLRFDLLMERMAEAVCFFSHTPKRTRGGRVQESRLRSRFNRAVRRGLRTQVGGPCVICIAGGIIDLRRVS